jgi:hypothetical protein
MSPPDEPDPGLSEYFDSLLKARRDDMASLYERLVGRPPPDGMPDEDLRRELEDPRSRGINLAAMSLNLKPEFFLMR